MTCLRISLILRSKLLKNYSDMRQYSFTRQTNKNASPKLCWKIYFGLEWDDEDFQVYSAAEFEECDLEAILVPENFDSVKDDL